MRGDPIPSGKRAGLPDFLMARLRASICSRFARRTFDHRLQAHPGLADMSHEARDETLSERAQQLLRVLIESYIREGQPVGSRVLSRDSGLHLSSATIRNVMADLEELGFVASPHTSAGR